MGKPENNRAKKAQPTESASLYARCSPNNWGMRYSIQDEKTDKLSYPVAREYAKAMKLLLVEKIKWGDKYFGASNPEIEINLPITGEEQMREALEILSPYISSLIATALISPSSSGFGIPSSAMPRISFNSRSYGQGVFNAHSWVLNLNVKEINNISGIRELRELANTIYHEVRHCQQFFWIYCLVQQRPDLFEFETKIQKIPYTYLSKDSINKSNKVIYSIIELTKQHFIPDEPTALIGIRRMAVGVYYWYLKNIQQTNSLRNLDQRFYPPYLLNEETFVAELEKAKNAAVDLLQNTGIGGTPIDVERMAIEPWKKDIDYKSRPWEDDAFFCGDLVDTYWEGGFGYIPSADQCSRLYELSYKTSNGKFQQ